MGYADEIFEHVRSQIGESGHWALLGSRKLTRLGSPEIGMSDRHTESGAGMLVLESSKPDYC